MERLKSLRTIVWLIAAIMLLQLSLLVMMIRPLNFFTWMAVGVVAILSMFLIRLSLSLIRELKNKEQNK